MGKRIRAARGTPPRGGQDGAGGHRDPLRLPRTGAKPARTPTSFDARYRRTVARTREYEKPIEIDLDLAQVDAGSILILPDRIYESQGTKYAGFRYDAHEMRLSLTASGVTTELATPPGTKPAIYDEHHAAWELPTLVGILGSGVFEIAGPFVVSWIRSKIASISEKDRSQLKLRYREAELNLETGQLRVCEIDGDPEAVAAAIEARHSGGSLPRS